MAEQTPDNQSVAQKLEAANRVMEELVDLAYERFVQETNFDFRDYLDEKELARYDEAEQAMNDVRKVVIEVLGGVAYVASAPPDVEVEIINHDNEERDA